jgi:hypothetical protein
MEGTRVCVVCGTVLIRHANEAPGRFAGRATCGGACKQEASRRTKRRNTPIGKVCATCGAPFERRPGEMLPAFRKRRTCGNRSCWLSCRGRARREPIEPHACAVCGETVPSKTGEPPSTYRARTVYGEACRLTSIVRTKRRKQESREREDRYCLACGTLLEWGADESITHFRRRKTCDRECARRLVGIVHAKPLPGKTCVVCGAPFARRATEPIEKYRNRKTCSRACARVFAGWSRKPPLAPRICQVCGASFSPADGEKAGHFLVRKTCAPVCAHALTITTRGHRIVRVSPYALEWTPELRKRIRHRDGNVCRWCGRTRQENGRDLQVHHIDYRKENCTDGNLVTLCGECHGKTGHDREYWQRVLSDKMAAHAAS